MRDLNLSSDLLAQLGSFLSGGGDITSLQQDLQRQQREIQNQKLIEQARSEGYGVLHIEVSANTPISTSSNKRTFVLGTVAGGDGIVVQGGRRMNETQVAKIAGKYTCDLTLNSDVKEVIKEFRRDLGGTRHSFTIILNGPSSISKLNAQFKSGDYQGENIYLVDPAGSPIDPNNWTAEENAHPLYEYWLSCSAGSIIGATVAQIPQEALPETEDEFEAFLEATAAVGAIQKEIGLNRWREERKAKSEAESADMQKEVDAAMTGAQTSAPRRGGRRKTAAAAAK